VADCCKSCDAPIIWAKDPAGQPVPVDQGEREDGNLAVQHARGGGFHVRPLLEDGALTVHEWRAASHYATCPDAEQWRERGRGLAAETRAAARARELAESMDPLFEIGAAQ
jgi:hypothetical protein